MVQWELKSWRLHGINSLFPFSKRIAASLLKKYFEFMRRFMPTINISIILLCSQLLQRSLKKLKYFWCWPRMNCYQHLGHNLLSCPSTGPLRNLNTPQAFLLHKTSESPSLQPTMTPGISGPTRPGGKTSINVASVLSTSQLLRGLVITWCDGFLKGQGSWFSVYRVQF